MSVNIGVLGDPAKLEKYPQDFYSLMNWDSHDVAFHLLGASESDVTKQDYLEMYNKFSHSLSGNKYEPIPGLSPRNNTSFNTRIGLFPSSVKHLIKGPSFTFAPFPINTNSWFLKLKSRILYIILSPLLSHEVHPLAYLPLGGKAAAKSKAKMDLGNMDIAELFYNARKSNYLEWFYLEAGSGEQILSKNIIQLFLKVQLNEILGLPINADPFELSRQIANNRVIVPRTVYGGGIRRLSDLKSLLEPKNQEILLVPEIIIIGNISEEDISITYNLVELVGELNSITTQYSVNKMKD